MSRLNFMWAYTLFKNRFSNYSQVRLRPHYRENKYMHIATLNDDSLNRRAIRFCVENFTNRYKAITRIMKKRASIYSFSYEFSQVLSIINLDFNH